MFLNVNGEYVRATCASTCNGKPGTSGSGFTGGVPSWRNKRPSPDRRYFRLYAASTHDTAVDLAFTLTFTSPCIVRSNALSHYLCNRHVSFNPDPGGNVCTGRRHCTQSASNAFPHSQPNHHHGCPDCNELWTHANGSTTYTLPDMCCP